MTSKCVARNAGWQEATACTYRQVEVYLGLLALMMIRHVYQDTIYRLITFRHSLMHPCEGHDTRLLLLTFVLAIAKQQYVHSDSLQQPLKINWLVLSQDNL